MKVGDYVRTKYGIEKIERIIPNDYDKDHDYIELENGIFDGLDIQLFFATNEIIKSSPNIIDLIEVGDLVNYEQVNGGYVLNKKENEIDTWSILPNSLKNEDIKSVITKEQLKSMQYDLESEVN